ncbi:unnamed protein product, partial [Durusdinium trenchii]
VGGQKVDSTGGGFSSGLGLDWRPPTTVLRLSDGSSLRGVRAWAVHGRSSSRAA